MTKALPIAMASRTLPTPLTFKVSDNGITTILAFAYRSRSSRKLTRFEIWRTLKRAPSGIVILLRVLSTRSISSGANASINVGQSRPWSSPIANTGPIGCTGSGS